MLELYADDAVWDLSPSVLDQSPIRGREAIRAYFDGLWARWASFRIDVLDVEPAADGVVASIEIDGVGRGTSVPTRQRFAHRLRFDGEKIARVEQFASATEARAAGGAG